MIGRWCVFIFLISIPASARQRSCVDFQSHYQVSGFFHSNPFSKTKFFYSIGTEWFNLYNYGITEKGYWNYTADFLPSSLNMEFRWNVIEKDSAHSCSISFAPQFGVSIFTASDELAEHAALPIFFQYNFGLGATHFSKRQSGYSLGIGPSINIINAQYYLFNPQNFIAIDFQYSRRRLGANGIIYFHYIRFGIDPAGEGIPKTGYHVNFGLGRVFGK